MNIKENLMNVSDRIGPSTHFMPRTKGETIYDAIDYQKVFEKLREVSYKGPIICEMQGNDLEQMLLYSQEAKEMIGGIFRETGGEYLDASSRCGRFNSGGDKNEPYNSTDFQRIQHLT